MAKSNAKVPTLIFIHIPKTAGKTFSTIIERQYPPNTLRIVSGIEQETEFKALPVEQTRNLAILSGHLHFGIHNYLEQSARYMTILRNPIDRMVSHYYFVREREHHQYSKIAQTYSLAEYFHANTDKDFDNQQTRYLAGLDSGEICTNATLEQAKTNMDLYFDLVGLTECFDEFALMAQARYGWSYPFYHVQNKSNRPQLEAISAEAIQALKEINQFDLQLYEYAQEKFKAQLERDTTGLAARVQRFQLLNKAYSIPFNLIRAAKNILR